MLVLEAEMESGRHAAGISLHVSGPDEAIREIFKKILSFYFATSPI